MSWRVSSTTEELVFRNAERFAAAFRSDLWPSGLFYGTYRTFAVGQVVTVKVCLGRKRRSVLLEGMVTCVRRRQRQPEIVGGIGIELDRGADAKVAYLLQLARLGADDRLVNNRRRHDRLPLDFPVAWQRATAPPFLASLNDIGLGGAFVKEAEPPPVGDDLFLGISPPGAEVPTVVTARVAWIRADDVAGFGVKWRARDTGGLRLIGELVSRISMRPTIGR